MKRTVKETMAIVLKSVFGTDERCRGERHTTEVLASHAERKIDRLNEATESLSKFQPAANLAEALGQIAGE